LYTVVQEELYVFAICDNQHFVIDIAKVIEKRKERKMIFYF
jgi:hypothetical protein